MASVLDRLNDKQAKATVASVEKIFKGLPHLPKGIVNFFVTIAPWVAGFAGVVGIMGGLSLLFSPMNFFRMDAFMRMAGYSGGYFAIMGVIQLASSTLLLLAFNHLKNKKMLGWMYLFWANVVGVVSSIVSVMVGGGTIVGVIISTFIGFYILFEMKGGYKK